MLGLRTRLTFAFLLLVGVLTGTTTFFLYRHAQAQFRADFEDRVAEARSIVTNRLRRDAEVLRARIRALASDPRVEHLIQDLENESFDRQRLVKDAEAMLRSADLDTLWLLDEQGDPRVLATPHVTKEVSPPGPLARYLSRNAVGHVVLTEEITRGGRTTGVPVLEVGVQRRRLRLVGGRVVGQAVAEELRIGGADLHVTIRLPSGALVASTLNDEDPDEEPPGFDTERVVLRNAGDDEPALVVSVHVSRKALERRVSRVVQAAGLVGVGAALLALILGYVIAIRITRPLESLVDATRRIADGERDIELPHGRRDEVGALVDAFSDMAEELEESEQQLRRSERVAAWQDIARELAHEIKNPLTPIQLAIETLRRTRKRNHPKFDEVFDESTATILEEVDRLKTIVSEFSQFARMPRPNPHPTVLNDLVHSAVVLYREEDGVTVEEHLDDAVGELMLDSDRMTQVIQNLLKNAIQATRAVERPGRVKIATRLMDDHVELSVSDNGVGIAEADLPRVFTPYFTSKSGGTGLGLAVVHRIITGHDGRIGVQSKPGEGTRFIVQLNRGQAQK